MGRYQNPDWYPAFEEVTGSLLEEATGDDMQLYMYCQDTLAEDLISLGFSCSDVIAALDSHPDLTMESFLMQYGDPPVSQSSRLILFSIEALEEHAMSEDLAFPFEEDLEHEAEVAHAEVFAPIIEQSLSVPLDVKEEVCEEDAEMKSSQQNFQIFEPNGKADLPEDNPADFNQDSSDDFQLFDSHADGSPEKKSSPSSEVSLGGFEDDKPSLKRKSDSSNVHEIHCYVDVFEPPLNSSS